MSEEQSGHRGAGDTSRGEGQPAAGGWWLDRYGSAANLRLLPPRRRRDVQAWAATCVEEALTARLTARWKGTAVLQAALEAFTRWLEGTEQRATLRLHGQRVGALLGDVTGPGRRTVARHERRAAVLAVLTLFEATSDIQMAMVAAQHAVELKTWRLNTPDDPDAKTAAYDEQLARLPDDLRSMLVSRYATWNGPPPDFVRSRP